MRMIPMYVLEPDEFTAVRRMSHLVGYILDDEERTEEQRVVGCLLRKNDPFHAPRYQAAYEALEALRGRLEAQTDPDYWSGAAVLMVAERTSHVALVDEALEALPHPSTLLYVPARLDEED